MWGSADEGFLKCVKPRHRYEPLRDRGASERVWERWYAPLFFFILFLSIVNLKASQPRKLRMFSRVSETRKPRVSPRRIRRHAGLVWTKKKRKKCPNLRGRRRGSQKDAPIFLVRWISFPNYSNHLVIRVSPRHSADLPRDYATRRTRLRSTIITFSQTVFCDRFYESRFSPLHGSASARRVFFSNNELKTQKKEKKTYCGVFMVLWLHEITMLCYMTRII